MNDLKGIPALFTACILLCTVINLFFFYKGRNSIKNIIIMAALLFINQSIEFTASFWNLNNRILGLIYIVTFNFSLSFSSYYLLEALQPGSKHNWKSFMFSIMILPVGFVYMNSFRMIDPGMFFTEFRYFASPMANIVLGMLTCFLGLFFLSKILLTNPDLRKFLPYKILLWGYIIPVVVFFIVFFISLNSILIFESLYSKLLVFNIAGLLYFTIKNKK
jgi:hypothetical protein